MLIIGADYHPGFQQIAFEITRLGNCKSGDCSTAEEAEKFYRDLAAQGMKLRVGMEASGHARWFERFAPSCSLSCGSETRPRSVRGG